MDDQMVEHVGDLDVHIIQGKVVTLSVCQPNS